MKKFIRTIGLILILFISVGSLTSQNPPLPPDNAGNSSGGGASGPIGAPIGGGLFILLGMAGIYGGYKGYKIWKEKRAEKEEEI